MAVLMLVGGVQWLGLAQGAPAEAAAGQRGQGSSGAGEAQKLLPVAAAGNAAANQPQRLSPVTVQVLKLMKAGVSRPVVEAFIEQTPIQQPLAASDLLALKELGVQDELTIALLRRATGQAEQTAAAPRDPNAAAPDSARGPGIVDPESYDFWWYHYAYPRALAAANDRVLSSYRYLPFEGYGYYPLPFAPGYLRAR
jgi:hypothetical protein